MQSLFHLARCVKAINENQKASGAFRQENSTKKKSKKHLRHSQSQSQSQSQQVRVLVPYKDDLLTFFLKDAIGGNCSTTVIVTCSPAQRHALETRYHWCWYWWCCCYYCCCCWWWWCYC